MNLEKAIEITKRCQKAREIAGHMADFPFSQHEMGDALSALLAQIGSLEEAVTLANRRYAAANARGAKADKAA